jgi:hypothetical protein
VALDAVRPRKGILLTLAMLAGVALTAFGAFWLLDYFLLEAAHRGPGAPGPLGQLFAFDAETSRWSRSSCSWPPTATRRASRTCSSAIR